MKQAVTELCRGMGVEISEQDSEKLRKDAFHPGRDTNTERAAQDTKNLPPFTSQIQTGKISTAGTKFE